MSNIPPAAPGDMIIVRLTSSKMRATLERFAASARLSLSDYGQRLFEAAYSARCAPTGDRELDQAVAEIGADRRPLTGEGAPSDPPNQGSGGVRPDQSAIVRLRQDNARLMAEVARLRVPAREEGLSRTAAELAQAKREILVRQEAVDEAKRQNTALRVERDQARASLQRAEEQNVRHMEARADLARRLDEAKTANASPAPNEADRLRLELTTQKTENIRLQTIIARLQAGASSGDEQASLERMTQGRSPVAPPETPRRRADALSGAMIKQIRGLAGIGKTPLNIADMLGLEIEVVKEILARRAA